MNRRDALKLLGTAGMTTLARPGFATPDLDVLVVGAGVFGVWTARALHQSGLRVALIDAIDPAHSGSSSGGESRVTRCGYGDAEIYTEWAHRSLAEWRALSARAALPLFHESGVLWLHRDGDPLVEATAKVLAKQEIPFSRWSAKQLRERFPVMQVGDDESGFYEPQGGGLMARRAVQTLAAELVADGVEILHGTVSPIRTRDAVGGLLPSLETQDGHRLGAEQFVFACGPWLDKACPDALGDRLFVTRQEVLYFAASSELTGDLPVWADLPFYGLPSFEGRGFKVANDVHGAVSNPDTMDRQASAEAIDEARAFLARRFPSLAGKPLSESRVCQYENSSNGDLVLDQHPGLENVWLAGCGSGHGFKHGPALGEHVAGLVKGTEKVIERFSLATKATRQKRAVQ